MQAGRALPRANSTPPIRRIDRPPGVRSELSCFETTSAAPLVRPLWLRVQRSAASGRGSREMIAGTGVSLLACALLVIAGCADGGGATSDTSAITGTEGSDRQRPLWSISAAEAASVVPNGFQFVDTTERSGGDGRTNAKPVPSTELRFESDAGEILTVIAQPSHSGDQNLIEALSADGYEARVEEGGTLLVKETPSVRQAVYVSSDAVVNVILEFGREVPLEAVIAIARSLSPAGDVGNQRATSEDKG